MAEIALSAGPLEDDPRRRPPLTEGEVRPGEVTEVVSALTERPRSTRAWRIAFAASLGLTGLFFGMIALLLWRGVGVWGNNSPVAWGFPIVNFVFWVGIGHAGTLISAVLFLTRQHWRTSIARFAEAMTIFAVVCAGVFPAVHVGRVYLVYWLAPYPNQMQMWPNFRSPLLWDVFAVSTYATVSALFWYMGLVPDFATLRDRARTRGRQLVFGLLALGWNGSARQWSRYEKAYLLLAGLATPLVLSVHSIVSFDFAVSQLPGWHTTIFPPYFVAGAVFSGFAMVLTLMIPARKLFGLEQLVTARHIEVMTKVVLATSLMVGYAYAIELFVAWYSGNLYERFAFLNRAMGPFAWAYWIMVGCNVVVPQLFWSARVRRKAVAVVVIALLVNVGMWFERFVITVTSLHRDFLPSSWADYTPTAIDVLTLLGSFGLFFSLFLLFCRYLPVVAMAEVKAGLPGAQPAHHDEEVLRA